MYEQPSQAPRNINKKLNDYWARVAEKYYVPDVFGRRIVQSFMMKMKPQSLIEVGCGSGELFSCYKNIPRVMAVDWQQKMLDRSRERIERHGYSNIVLAQVDIAQHLNPDGPLRFDFRYDIALTRTVLMHIDPQDIEVACLNMTLLSDTVLAFEYYDPNKDPQTLAHHNWHHEYPAIFKGLGYRMVEAYQRPDDVSQILFHFTRETDAESNQGKPGKQGAGA